MMEKAETGEESVWENVFIYQGNVTEGKIKLKEVDAELHLLMLPLIVHSVGGIL